MKKSHFALLLCLSLLFNACYKEFNPNGPFKPVTIVYTLLDPAQNIHYVRVQKAFLDKETNALTIADINDSIYYPNNLSVNINGEGAYYSLNRVVGDSFNVLKEEGIFSNSPNILYRINTSLKVGGNYQVKVSSEDNPEENVEAYVTLVNPAVGRSPVSGVSVNLADTNGVSVNFSTGKDAVFYQIIFRLHYKEWLVSSPSDVDYKYVEWVAANNVVAPDANGGDLVKLIVPSRNMYRQMMNVMEVNEDLRRQYDEAGGLEVIYYAGGQALYDYTRVKNAQAGITSNEALPVFTNVDNGLGLVSSRTVSVSSGIQINGFSIDSLSCGSITKTLNFANSSGLWFNCPD